MKFDYYKYHICGHYLSALINGDESSFDDEDIAAYISFLDEVPNVSGHWDVIDDEPSFRMDDVTGLMADCYECRYYFPIN